MTTLSFARPFITRFSEEFERPIEIPSWFGKITAIMFTLFRSINDSCPVDLEMPFGFFLGNFDRLPKEKVAGISKILETVQVSRNFKDCQELPVSERMEVMEKVYPGWGQTEMGKTFIASKAIITAKKNIRKKPRRHVKDH